MSMNINDMKDTLCFRDRETAEKMLEFIQKTLNITDSGCWNFIGKEIICVDPKEYERVLLEAKKYAISKDYGMSWINAYNECRDPIASLDIGLGILPKELLEGEKENTDRHIWMDEDDRPMVLKNYLDLMKEYLGEEIIRMKVDYRGADNALRFAIVTKEIDHEKYKKLLAEFIMEHGYGPFEVIHPLTSTGKFVKEPFSLQKDESVTSEENTLKGVFITGEEDVKNDMLEYIQDLEGISEADWGCYCGRYVINVPKEKYEEVLRKGKEYACEIGLINHISWLDYQDEMRYPICSCDIGYAFLPETLLPGEKTSSDITRTRVLWDTDEYAPKTLLEYFKAMKEFLDVDISRHYKFSENAMIIAPHSLDYEETMAKFTKFIELYGYGPFERIKPLSFTGKIDGEPFQYKKRK